MSHDLYTGVSEQAIVNRWIPAWRYTADLSNCQDAEDFLEAVENLMRWIDNNV